MVQWHPIKCNPKAEKRNNFWYTVRTDADDILSISRNFKVKITDPDQSKIWDSVNYNWVKDENSNEDKPWRNMPDTKTVMLGYTPISVEEINTYLWSSSEYEKYLRIKDQIEVGDFVRCSGSRDSKSWRKITEINDYEIVGQKYNVDRNGNWVAQPYMSTNMIKTITQVIKKDFHNDNCS